MIIFHVTHNLKDLPSGQGCQIAMAIRLINGIIALEKVFEDLRLLLAILDLKNTVFVTNCCGWF